MLPIDTSYSRSRIQLTPNTLCQNQKFVVPRRDKTPELKECCIQETKQFQYSCPIQQFPVQMQHIRLNQLEQDYSSQLQSIDLTPQRQQKSSIITNPNNISVNLSMKHFNALKQVNTNSSSQKTPMGSSSKQLVQVHEDPQRQNISHKFGNTKENSNHNLIQQLNDLRKQKENICITLSETFKKNQQLQARVQELQSQLEEQKNAIHQNYKEELECLQDKIIELTNQNSTISNINSQYQIKIQQLDGQLKTQRQTDQKRINDLQDELKRQKEELTEELKQARKARNDVLEMNQSLENELREAGERVAELQRELDSKPCSKPPTEHEKALAMQLVALNANLGNDMDTSDQHQMQINQLHSVIEGLKLENQILFEALQRK